MKQRTQVLRNYTKRGTENPGPEDLHEERERGREGKKQILVYDEDLKWSRF